VHSGGFAPALTPRSCPIVLRGKMGLVILVMAHDAIASSKGK